MYFKDKGQVLTHKKYRKLLTAFDVKTKQFKSACTYRFEFNTKLNYLFKRTLIRFNHNKGLQTIVDILQLNPHKERAQSKEKADELFVIAVQEQILNKSDASDQNPTELKEWARKRKVISERVLMAGSPNSSSSSPSSRMTGPSRREQSSHDIEPMQRIMFPNYSDS
jgi:hypothetical protein